MDQTQLLKEPPKQQNPLLKRKPLNLGQKFAILNKPEETAQFEDPLQQADLILLFFAAQWCNISKSFIPHLKKTYQEVNLQNKKLQIIYVGLDKVKKDFDTFTKQMPWLGLNFADERTAGLKQFYDVRAIPKLLLLDMKGQQVRNNNRVDVYNMNEDDLYDKWSRLKEVQDKSYNL